MAAKLIAISEEKAVVLEKLLRIFGPLVDDLDKASVAILGLRMADGSNRTVKTISVTLEDSEPTAQGSTGTGLPEGTTWEEFTICASGSPATRWIPTSATDPS